MPRGQVIPVLVDGVVHLHVAVKGYRTTAVISPGESRYLRRWFDHNVDLDDEPPVPDPDEYRSYKTATRFGFTATVTTIKVVELLAEGMTNKEIAQRLGKKEETVRSQLLRLYAHNGVRTRAGLVAKAMRAGVVH